MKKTAILPSLCLCALCLCACGPREIGQGSSSERRVKTDINTAEQMRLPLTGVSRTDQMLYYYNKPSVMERVSNWKIDQFNRKAGVMPEDSAYHSIPKQASPFRE